MKIQRILKESSVEGHLHLARGIECTGEGMAIPVQYDHATTLARFCKGQADEACPVTIHSKSIQNKSLILPGQRPDAIGRNGRHFDPVVADGLDTGNIPGRIDTAKLNLVVSGWHLQSGAPWIGARGWNPG